MSQSEFSFTIWVRMPNSAFNYGTGSLSPFTRSWSVGFALSNMGVWFISGGEDQPAMCTVPLLKPPGA